MDLNNITYAHLSDGYVLTEYFERKQQLFNHYARTAPMLPSETSPALPASTTVRSPLFIHVEPDQASVSHASVSPVDSNVAITPLPRLELPASNREPSMQLSASRRTRVTPSATPRSKTLQIFVVEASPRSGAGLAHAIERASPQSSALRSYRSMEWSPSTTPRSVIPAEQEESPPVPGTPSSRGPVNLLDNPVIEQRRRARYLRHATWSWNKRPPAPEPRQSKY